MKYKRLLAIILVIAMCLSFVSCKNVDKTDNDSKPSVSSQSPTVSAVDDDSISPLLYRVTDKRGNVIWLFGSIHVGIDDYYPLPDYVLDAFDGSDSLAVEADIVAFEKNFRQQSEALSLFVYTDGSSIEDHIPKRLYNKSVEILEEYDTYFSMLDMYYPIMWSSTIDSLLYEEFGADGMLGIDRHLINRANDSDKEILEVESVEFQYQMMADFSENLQIILLEGSVESYEDKETAKEDVFKLMDLWAEGDEEALAKYLSEEPEDLTDEEMELYIEYNNAMIVERNMSMTDYAEDALKSGDEVFICVGAAHIIGEDAMVDLLRERGYKVECIKN